MRQSGLRPVESMLAGRHLARLSVVAALLLSPPVVLVRAQEVPSDSKLQEKRTKADVVAGRALLIRIFKEESQLELWVQSAETLQLLATYPVCFWSGNLGPKLFEGDHQAPRAFTPLASTSSWSLENTTAPSTSGFPMHSIAHLAALAHTSCCMGVADPSVASR